MYKKYKKQIWLLLAALLFFPLFTNLLAWIPTPITKGNLSTWIGFFGGYFGSMVGGILGAIIAFAVAKYQIDQQKIVERERTYVNQLPVLIKVRLELDAINSNLQNVKAVFKNNSTPIPIDLDSPMKLPEVNLVEIGELSMIINPELQAELIDLKYYHIDMVKVIAFDTRKVNLEITKITSQLDKLSQKKNKSQSEEMKVRELTQVLVDLTLEFHASLSNKQYYFDNLNKYLEMVSRLKEEVNIIYGKAVVISQKFES